jgi:hypothetical protein
MKPVATFSLAVVLAAVLTGPGFAVVSSEQAREANARNQVEPSSQATTPWSSTMSSPNTPSHDGNSQLGTNQRNSIDAPDRARTTMPRSPTISSANTPNNDSDRPLGQRDSTNPAATNPGCGGAC